MLWKKYKRIEEKVPLVEHQGIFHRRLNLFQAVSLIVAATIGAGVFGIPYAVSRVGLPIGLTYIVILGLLMMGLHLMLGEVATRTKEHMQLVGLARKYLGRTGEWLMTLLFYLSMFGVLVIYIIGEGEALSALFGFTPFFWSIVFFAVASFLIFIGLRTIKTVEFILTLLILFVVLVIAWFSAGHIQIDHVKYFDLAYLLFPYGVILFAFHGTNSIPEAHRVLSNSEKNFKWAIIISGIISIIVYSLFAFVVVGVTGLDTTEIATIGLGQKLGNYIFIFGNIFAVLAMGSSFLMAGLSLRDSLRWDYKLPTWLSSLVVGLVPLIIFLAGLNHFIVAIDIVGGVFVSLEMITIILIYWRAKTKGDLEPPVYKLHHTLPLAAILLLALVFGAIYSVVKLF